MTAIIKGKAKKKDGDLFIQIIGNYQSHADLLKEFVHQVCVKNKWCSQKELIEHMELVGILLKPRKKTKK